MIPCILNYKTSVNSWRTTTATTKTTTTTSNNNYNNNNDDAKNSAHCSLIQFNTVFA
jgi:hypothetical protein